MNSTNAVLIIGESGSGKSSSFRNLDPKSTVIINVSANKPLPFKGWKKNYTLLTKDNPTGNFVNVSSAAGIASAMMHVSNNMPHIKTLIVDDLQFMSAFEYYDKADEKGFDKFTKIAKSLAEIIRLPSKMRDDLNVFFTMHPETIVDTMGRVKIKAKSIHNWLSMNESYCIL